MVNFFCMAYLLYTCTIRVAARHVNGKSQTCCQTLATNEWFYFMGPTTKLTEV
jgi:hypothetical protein